MWETSWSVLQIVGLVMTVIAAAKGAAKIRKVTRVVAISLLRVRVVQVKALVRVVIVATEITRAEVRKVVNTQGATRKVMRIVIAMAVFGVVGVAIIKGLAKMTIAGEVAQIRIVAEATRVVA